MLSGKFLFCLFSIWITGLNFVAQAQDVDSTQSSQATAEIIEQLRFVHGITQAKKAEEDLFLIVPLASPNETASSETGQNSTIASIKPKHKKKRSKGFASPTRAHKIETRQETECRAPLWQEGDDPCQGRENEPGFVRCDQPCTYTRDWFLSNTIYKPGINECLFYSGGMSENARQYATAWTRNRPNQPISTIWQYWAPRQYNNKPVPSNPMRCIIQKDIFQGRRNQNRQKYFEQMSDTMAFMCGGRVVMMESNMNAGGTGIVKRRGIWGRVEFPRLRLEGQVNGVDVKWRDPTTRALRVCSQIDVIGPDQVGPRPAGRYWRRWWVRGGPVWPEESPVPIKRQVHSPDVEERGLERRAPPENSEVNSAIYDDGGEYSLEW